MVTVKTIFATRYPVLAIALVYGKSFFFDHEPLEIFSPDPADPDYDPVIAEEIAAGKKTKR